MDTGGYMSSSKWDKNWSLDQSMLFRKVIHLTTDYYHKIIKKMFVNNHISGDTVLELGCGSAEDTIWFINKLNYKKATVVDFSDKALERVETIKDGLNIQLVNENILNLKLKDKFDLVHSGFVVEHFYGKDREKVIKKHGEFVGENGFVFIQAPGKTVMSKFYSKTINKINGINEILYSEKELLSLINNAGLKIVEMKTLFNKAIYFLLLQK